MKLIFKNTLILIAPLAFLSCEKKDAEVQAETATSSEGAVKPYPLEVCAVSGEKLGSMGDPVRVVHEGQEIKFCCDNCIPKFKKDPAKYLEKLETSEQ